MSDYPLSGNDILERLDGKVNIVPYDQMHKFETIDELISPHSCAIVLYLTKQNYGHWVAVLKRGDTVEIFDSYGTFPDAQQDLIDDQFKEVSYQDQPYLSDLLRRCYYDLEYNHHRFQGKDSTTCGRWCVLRLMFSDLTLDQFIELFSQFKDEDIVRVI